MILRDLPEFHEVAGDGAFFFSASDGAGVRAAILDWIRLRSAGAVPQPRDDIAIGWDESARQLLAAIADRAAASSDAAPQSGNR